MMKATRKSVARSTSAAALIAALVAPLSVQAQAEQGNQAAAPQAQPKKEQPSSASQGTQGAKPQGNAPGVGRTAAPGTAAPGTAAPGTATRGAPGTPGSTGAKGAPGASNGPAASGTRAAPKTTTGPQNADTPGPSADAAIKREQLLERRRARTLEEYEKSYNQLNAPADGKKLSKKERSAIKKRMVSAERRIVALHRADEQSYRALTKDQREQIAARVKQRREALKADRAERAEKERQKIRTELGDKVTRKPIQNELRQHAWRIARLNHLLTLAEAREKADAVKQAQLLIEKENARHSKALATLKMLPPEADGPSEPAAPAGATKPKAPAGSKAPTEKKEGASL